MEDNSIQTPNIGSAHTFTSNLPLDALGPGSAAEGTYPSNDASCKSLGVVMPSNADFLLPSDNNDALHESLGIKMQLKSLIPLKIIGIWDNEVNRYVEHA